MKNNITQDGRSTRIHFSLVALGLTAAMAVTIACSENSKPSVKTSQPAEVKLRQASLEPVAPALAPPANATSKSSQGAMPASKLLTYKSRNYGVSFQYPWQYSYLSAKAVASSEVLQPTSDGHDGQFTLARIDVPQGFYSDTDFDSGYFALSLNQDINEQECEASLAVPKDAKPSTEVLNGAEFHGFEINSGGRGSASKIRKFVNFSNGTCYEVELAVKTKNADGMAREIDPDQVMRRLDSILKSVKVESLDLPAGPKDAPAAVAQN